MRPLLRVLLALLATGAAFFVWVYGPLVFATFGIDTQEKVLALTFDDGPYPPYTNELLELLDAEGVRATFFVTGAHLAAHPELGRRMVAAGHVLANHSWDAAVLAFTAPVGIEERIARTDRLLREIGAAGGAAHAPASSPLRGSFAAQRLPDFRAPRAMPGWVAAWQLWRAGRRHVLGVGVGDWPGPGLRGGDCLLPLALACPTQDPDVIEARLLGAARPGAILVLHDGYDGGPGADRSGSVEAVRRAIPRLRADGYRFVTVPELLDGAAP